MNIRQFFIEQDVIVYPEVIKKLLPKIQNIKKNIENNKGSKLSKSLLRLLKHINKNKIGLDELLNMLKYENTSIKDFIDTLIKIKNNEKKLIKASNISSVPIILLTLYIAYSEEVLNIEEDKIADTFDIISDTISTDEGNQDTTFGNAKDAEFSVVEPEPEISNRSEDKPKKQVDLTKFKSDNIDDWVKQYNKIFKNIKMEEIKDLIIQKTNEIGEDVEYLDSLAMQAVKQIEEHDTLANIQNLNIKTYVVFLSILNKLNRITTGKIV